MLVHASFAFVLGRPQKDPLRSIAETILECEQLVLSGSVPACVVRLGYLYGPASRDLLAYRAAFRIGRPYWAGPRRALQYHLHQFDAVGALLAAAAVSVAGVIGFVGLMTPHVLRLFVGSDHRRLLPASLLGGAIFMVLADLVARTAMAPEELPLGAVTALIGAPFFLWLLRREHGRSLRGV